MLRLRLPESSQGVAMNVSLTPELDQFIADQLESGRYRSASEIVREGLRLLQHREEEHAAKLELLRKAVSEGIAQLDRGEGIDGAEAFAEILRGLDQSEAA